MQRKTTEGLYASTHSLKLTLCCCETQLTRSSRRISHRNTRRCSQVSAPILHHLYLEQTCTASQLMQDCAGRVVIKRSLFLLCAPISHPKSRTWTDTFPFLNHSSSEAKLTRYFLYLHHRSQPMLLKGTERHRFS